MIANLSIPRQSRRSLVLLSSIFLPLSLLFGSGGGSSAQQSNAAPLINIGGVTINIPITVIIPITLNAQNAQVCLSAASSGSQTCQQVILNPSQNTFSPVNVDLTLPTPVFTSLSSTTTAASPSTTTSAGTPLTSNPTNNAPAPPPQNVPNNGPSQNVPTNPSSNGPTNPRTSSGSSNSGSGTAGGSSGSSK